MLHCFWEGLCCIIAQISGDQISELSFSLKVPTIKASYIAKLVMSDVFLLIIIL
jgi:hypothetical protein